MIRIQSIGTDVMVDIDHGLPGCPSNAIRLKWGCGDEILAAALAKVLRDALEARVVEVGNEAYARGWADAKAKRAKLKAWFRSWL